MNKKQLEKYYKNEMMEEVDRKPFPKDFLKWVERTVFNSYVMLVSRIGAKRYLGKCQYCKSENIDLKDIKVGTTIKCPYCGHKVTIKNEKYSNFENKDFVWLLQKCSTGFVMTLFEFRKISNGINYFFNYTERERCFISEDLAAFRWFHYSTAGWYNGRYSNMSYTLPYCNYTYFKNLRMLNKVKGFEYCPFVEYCKMFGEYSSVIELIKTYKTYPVIEKFIKCKLTNLSEYLLKEYCSKPFAFNYGAKDLKSILKLKKASSFRYVLENNIDWERLKSLRILDEQNIEITDENLKIAHYITLLNESAFKYFGFNGFKNYFLNIHDESNLSYLIYDYNDYFKNCLKLGRNMQDTKWLKPKNFKVAHDQAQHLVKSMESKQLDAAVKKILKTYLMLNFEDDKYCVVIPKTANDIRLEGKNMNNCVASYVDRVASKNSIICFVRHKNRPDKSFYTLELNPDTLSIVQCRGYNNKPSKEDKQVQAFCNKWREKVVLRYKDKLSILNVI